MIGMFPEGFDQDVKTVDLSEPTLNQNEIKDLDKLDQDLDKINNITKLKGKDLTEPIGINKNIIEPINTQELDGLELL